MAKDDKPLNQEQQIQVEQIRHNIVEKSTKWLLAVLGLIYLLVNGILGLMTSAFFDVKELLKIPEWKFLLFYYFLSTAVIGFLIFMTNNFLLRRICRTIASNHLEYDMLKTDLSAHISAAADVPNTLTTELQKQIDSAKQLSSLLKDLNSPHLIHWDRSAQLELNAEFVYAISNDFNWLRASISGDGKEQFYHIISDAVCHETDCYHFLATDTVAEQKMGYFSRVINELTSQNSEIRNYVKKRLTDTGKKMSDFEPSIATIKERILFKSLLSIDYYNKQLHKLPLPSDIVIYDKTRFDEQVDDQKSSYLVISMIPIKDSNNNKFVDQYDTLFRNGVQVDRIRDWFLQTWNAILEIEMKPK